MPKPGGYSRAELDACQKLAANADRTASATAAGITRLLNKSIGQARVFRRIGEGRNTRQIAEALKLSVKTIESHREHIKQTMSLKSSAALAQRATQWVETGRAG